MINTAKGIKETFIILDLYKLAYGYKLILLKFFTQVITR